MFIARNTYEVTILAYFEQIGLEKNTEGSNNTVLKKVDIHVMNA